jgi:two-component system, NarL family, sensor kinase
MDASEKIEFYVGLLTSMAVLLLLAGGFVLIFIRSNRKIMRQKAEIFEKEARHKEDLLHSSIESVENERRRIAKDIHDELGSIFSTLSLQMSQAGMVAAEESLKLRLSESKNLISEGLKSVRRIAHEIMPPELELFGLEKTLENFFIRLDLGSDTRFELDYDATLPDPGASASLAIYRIVQELVTNTIKHAGARTVLLRLRKEAPGLVLIYTDDGRGMNLQEEEARRGLGLKNIEGRISLVKGKASYKSGPGIGFECRVEVPLYIEKTQE